MLLLEDVVAGSPASRLQEAIRQVDRERRAVLALAVLSAVVGFWSEVLLLDCVADAIGAALLVALVLLHEQVSKLRIERLKRELRTLSPSGW